ncbi:hypothetical protein OH492_01185 [Vibrio chagasii]|nr:hypothetical protein [Vibrio chagasii]
MLEAGFEPTYPGLGADPEKLSSPVFDNSVYTFSDNEEFTMETESRFIKKL